MKLRNALGLQILNTPTGLSLHIPGPGKLLDTDLLEQKGVLPLLLFCTDWQPRAAVEQLLVGEAGLTPQRAAKAVDELLQHDVLMTDANEEHRVAARAYESWGKYDWSEALLFQWHIDHLPHLDYSVDGHAEDRKRIKGFLQEDPVPSNYKQVPGGREVPLPKDVQVEHEPIWKLLTQESDFPFPERPLTLSELSWMTYLAFGQVRTISTYYGDRVSKTSPSGGARHPTEAYLLALEIEGVEPGAYHYNVEKHSLELLETGDFGGLVRDHLLRKPNLAPFKHRAAFVTGSRCERTMWRYRESFSYRSINHDLGHLMESTRLLARALRRNHFRGYAPRESALESCLRLDGIEEAAMTFSIIG